MSHPISLHNISAVNGIYQNTVYGLAAKLPFKYTGAVVLGSVSGVPSAALATKRTEYFSSNQ